MKKRVLSLFLAITLCLTLTPTGALAAEGQPPEQTVSVTQEAETGAGENASPANLEENPTEDAPAAAEKNTADEETGKEAGQNKPTAEGKNEPLALGLDDAGQDAADGENGEAGGTSISEEDTRTEIWCKMKPSSIQRGYDGTTDGSTIPIDLTFTDGTNEIELKEGTGFTAKKTFDSADAGWHTVTVEIALIGEAAVKYKLKAGEEKFEIGGNINKAYPNLTVSLSKTACTAGEKLLPLLSVEGAPEDAEVTYYYLASALKSWAGSSDVEGSDAMPKIDENTAISEPGTYYVYAKTGETTNYEEERSTTVELTVNEPVVEAASVTTSSGVTNNYTSLDDALNAAQNGDTVTLLSDVDLGETYVTIDKSITFDLNGKTLSSSKAWLLDGVLVVKNATVTVKNGTVKAAGDGSCAIRAYRSGANMTLEDVTATVTSDKSSVTVGDFGSAVIKSGDYQGLYVGAKSQVTLEGGTFRPYMDTTTNENVKSIFWKVNETTDATSRDCMELLGNGCVYVDENQNQVRTGGGFNTVVTVQQGTAIDAPVAKIGDVEYASLSKAIDAVQNGGTITLLDDLDLGNGAVLQVGSSKKDFTIDLNSHTLSADGACLIMLHNGSQLTLKNGTLDGSRCTSYNGVLYISSNSGPKLTLENVTAKSGTVTDTLNGQRPVLLAYVAYGTVVFDGGTYTGGVLLETDGNAVLKSGTFQKGTNDYSIKTEDSGKHLSDYLDDDSQFWEDNTPLDLSNETQTADEVTVRPCEHKWENGKCTVCQKVCDHGSADGKSMTEDPCPTCGMKAAAQVDITGSDAKYFPSFTDALVYATKNNGCTLKLLADVTGTTVMINNPFIFDLNGHSVDALSVNAKATIKDSGTTKGRIGKVTVSNEKVTDLTLGGLLEEGYAFKYGNGYWADDSYLQTTEGSFVTVEKAPIQSVNVYAKDKNNQEILTIAYGATGEVTLVSSCKLSETSGGNLSCAWYKLTDDAAIPPLEGATGTSYTLPADLPAGTHTYLVTFTSDYYSKSAEITITVTPISLEDATVTVSNLTYNGNPQEPTVTVKLGDETLSRDNDYTVQVTKQTNAGSYKLTIKGGGNYSGEIKDVEWKIEPMKIDSVMVSSDISKVYDGTAEINMTAEEWAKVLTFKTRSAYDVVSVPSDAYTISDAYFVKKSGEETIYSPDAGEKYGITFKITLNDDNYVLQTYGEDTPSTSKVITQSGGAIFTIAQADAPTNIRNGALNVINGTTLEYTYDAKQILPAAPNGTYGTVLYSGKPSSDFESGYTVNSFKVGINSGVLTLTIDAQNGGKTGKIGSVTIYVTTDNYASFDLPLDLYAVNKITPVADGEITAAGITYGDALSKSTISGKMKDSTTGDEVKGTFAWTDGTIKPAASDNYEAEWTFTPAAGYEKYATATGTVTVKVNKATIPANAITAPAANALTYNGNDQALITAGSVTSGGTMQYSLTENGTYSQNIPVGTDAGTYTVWYRVIGDANHNDTAPASVAVSIGKKPLTITGVTAASKTYDGTTDAGITSVTFDGVNLNRGTDYTVTANFDDAGVDNDKHITATVTLRGQAAKNYFLEQSSFPTTGSIIKAAAPDFTKETTLVIINDYEKTYTVTLPALPTLETPKEYGALTYEIGEIKLNDGYYTSGAKVENGELTLPIQKNDVGTTGPVGTVTVVIKSTNYEDITLTVKVNAANKIEPTPDGEITATPITYGDTLSKSKISGKMKDPDTGIEVKGTFAWPYPDDKPKRTGDYNISWIFTPDESYGGIYAAVTDPVKVHVAPKSIEGATITLKKYEFAYNAAEQSPKITRVTLDNWDETGITYIIKSGGSATNANDSITLTIEGTGNYTGTATVEWKIIPAELTVSVSSVEKAYDGTPNATVTPMFDGLQGGETLTAADYSVTAAFEDAKVGYKKLVTGKVTLNQTDTAKNYLLKNDGTFSTGKGTIKKADAPTVQPVELTIYNDVQKDYFVDLPPLPELGEGKSYGTVNYNNPHAINLSEGYTAQSTLVADPENLKTYRLLLRMNQTGSLTEEIGTVTIPVTTSNYQDINLTVKVSAVNQIKPKPDDGTINATPITYGNELSMSTITGTMKDPTTLEKVIGTFTWVTPDEKLKAGSHNAEWIFTPDASYGGKYTTNNGTATVTVNRKMVTVSGITANDKVYDGTTNAKLNFSNAKFAGILENDTLTVTAKGVFEKADIGKQKVTISDLTLGGASAANYVLAESGNQSETTATITAKEVTITITPNGGTYGSVVAATAKLTGAVDGKNVPVTLTYTGNDYNSTTVPVNAGSYTVTASIADSNYVLTGKTTANFVIEPKSIKDAKVVLGKGLAANGAEQTQTVEKVLLGDKEIPADSYTVTGNTATAHGIYTLTVTGKGNYTDSIAWTYVIAPSKAEDAPGEDIAISSGKVKVVVLPEGAVPSVGLLTDKAELLAMLVNSGDITADELVQIANGASVDIVLTVKEANVSAEIKTAMAQAAKGCTIGQYLDISLLKYMTVNGSQQAAVAMPTTKDALTISVAVPDALINTNSAVNRTYCIVRNHKGTIDVLDAAFDAAGKTLTFKTDRFSIYAIAYKDTAVPSSGSNPGSNNSSNGSETKKNEVAAPTPAPTPAITSKPSTITAMPQTGDTSNPTLYVVLLVASLLGLAVVFVCKKRNDK